MAKQECSKSVPESTVEATEAALEAAGYRVSGEANLPVRLVQVTYERDPQQYYCGICGWVHISRFPNCH